MSSEKLNPIPIYRSDEAQQIEMPQYIRVCALMYNKFQKYYYFISHVWYLMSVCLCAMSPLGIRVRYPWTRKICTYKYSYAL